MHRSGTSCAGNLLTKLGFYFGDETRSIGASDQNRKGFFERRDVRDICDAILQGSGCDWWAVNEFSPLRVPTQIRLEVAERFAKLLSQLESHRPWFIKEPRLCLVWPLLRPTVPDPVYLHVWRDPLEVARSLAIRNGFSMDFSIALWEAYVRSAHAASQGGQSILLSYNELIRNPEKATEKLVKQLRECGIAHVRMPRKAAILDAVDFDLYRQRQTSTELEGMLTQSQRRLRDALAKGKPENNALIEPMDAVSLMRIDDWVRREGSILALRSGALKSKAITESAARVEEQYRAEQSELKSQISKLNSVVRDRDHEIKAAREAEMSLAAHLEEKSRVWDQERRSLNAKLDAAAQSSVALENRIKELREQASNQVKLNKEQNERIAKCTNEIEALKSSLANERHQNETKSGEIDHLNEEIAKQARELSVKEAAVGRMAERISAFKDEIRHCDAYLETLRNHIRGLRGTVEEKLGIKADNSEVSAKIDANRMQALQRHAHGSAVKTLFGGVRASHSLDKAQSRAHRALYLHYSLVHRRKDAAELASLALSGLFDPVYYLKNFEDVAQAGMDPLIHYVDFGAKENRNPSDFFDTEYYVSNNLDVVTKKLNPLLHYLELGIKNGRPTRALEANRIDWNLPPPPTPRISRDSLKVTPKRIVIYTAVAGGYDDLQPPTIRPPNCDFVVFSDHALHVDGWQVQPLNYLHLDPTRGARFIKLHPHVYFQNYDHSIWVDANIGIRGDITVFLDRLSYESFLGIFTHPLRDCIYVEGNECIKRKKDNPEVINTQLARYRAQGFPEHAGLWETNVLARRHNEPACIALMTAWWREIEIASRRDQISLPVVAKDLSVKIAPLGKPGDNAREHDLLTLTKHRADRSVPTEALMLPSVRKNTDIDSLAIDIGVCVHNSLKETQACLESSLAAKRAQDTIIVVDDASDAQTAGFLDRFAKDHADVKLVRHRKNRGYTKSANEIFKQSGADWVILLNSDTIVPKNAFRKIISCGESYSHIGIVGPLSNAASWQTVPDLTGSDGKFLINEIKSPLTVDDMDRICEELATGIVPFVPLINGFCYAVRRRLIKKIGLFDEKRFPMGYGEEDDFSLRAGGAGFLCAIAADTYVYHTKSASFTSERRKGLVEAGATALRQKHSGELINAAVATMKNHPELMRIRARILERLNAS